MIEFLLDIFAAKQNSDFIIWRGQSFSYSWLLDRIDYWKQNSKVNPGTVVTIEADFSPNAIALLLALIEHACIVVPLTRFQLDKIELAQVEVISTIDDKDNVQISQCSNQATHPYYQKLRNTGRPGLVLFSSGSTGQTKAAVHDFIGILEKFRTPRHNLRTIPFLLFDHIGGLDTLFYSVSNGSCLVIADDRSPAAICCLIEKYKVEVLPVSPTFLNLLILSEVYQKYDLSSLKYVTYGTEIMPQVTLDRCQSIFPNAILLQKYGTTEIGTLRSKSKANGSVWVKLGGEGIETRVVDGILEIKAQSAMLGYLNASSPFTPDGWFYTGDQVEVDGEYMRFLGRDSDIINIGGLKVYPAEVENVIQEMPEVAEVTVYGEKNSIIGYIVCAKISLREGISQDDFLTRVQDFCESKLQPYKIPIKISFSEQTYSERFKKIRN